MPFQGFRRPPRCSHLAELSEKIAELETRFEREFADVHDTRWLGKETRPADEITAMQTENPRFDEWQNRARIGFKKKWETLMTKIVALWCKSSFTNRNGQAKVEVGWRAKQFGLR
ncbi:MAG: hypothetical protein IPH12_22675 [Saprospirales bacterium]|nr:hypothetical protein [Saprospirales bacterium]